MEKNKKYYFYVFKRLSNSEIANIVTCALETLAEKDQLEIFRKFFENMDDPKKKRRFQNKINEFIEKKTRWRRAERWMETYMKKNPDEKPKAVAEMYMLIARIDSIMKKAYIKLAQTIKDRLRKRKKRSGDIGVSKTVPENRK
jgi:hypothetical protein